MTVSHRRLASIAVTACCAVSATGALAAQASAATLAADKACYVNDSASGVPMTITGTGFIPGSTVQLTGGTAFANTTADAAGNVTFTANAPKLATLGPGSKKTRLTVSDNNGTSATIDVMSANLAVVANPGSVRNVRKDKVTFSFSGFVPGKHIYGYYLRKKVVAKARFGKAQGPCGVLKQKALLYPGGRPSSDKYKVTFESSSRYNKNVFPRVTGTLNILHF
ncbi:MAG TPA: hypothetical protein VGH67_13065 [Solirubrobacteraceae bacterium]|jgi:hypothetical protein